VKSRIKFIADVNVEKSIVDYLKYEGFDIMWIPDYNCMMKDEELLRLANKERRVLITNDKDFGNLVFFKNLISSGIILFHAKEHNVEWKEKILKKVIDDFGEKVCSSFIVIGKDKVRIKPLVEE